MLRDKAETFFEHSHHAEPEQIDLDDTEVSAIFLVPLHNNAIGHGCRFEGDDGIKLSLTNDHAAGMLAEMPWQVLNGNREFDELAQSRMAKIEAGIGKLALQRFIRTFVFPRTHNRGKTIERLLVETHGLANLASGKTSAIGNDVSSHGGAKFSVGLIDVLNDTLALVAAGQIEIDVGPLAAFVGEEALEEQAHLYRVHGGNAEHITDDAVGRRTTTLHKNVLLAAEADDVPHDDEIACQCELFDQRYLTLDLNLSAVAQVFRGMTITFFHSLAVPGSA